MKVTHECKTIGNMVDLEVKREYMLQITSKLTLLVVVWRCPKCGLVTEVQS